MQDALIEPLSHFSYSKNLNKKMVLDNQGCAKKAKYSST